MTNAEEKNILTNKDSNIAITSEEEPVLSLLVKPNPKLHVCVNDFTQRCARSLKYFLPGTRISFLKQVSDWLNSPEMQKEENFGTEHKKQKNNRTIFWLSGDAGTGKTIMSSRLIQLEYNHSLIGWHFCSHTNILQNSTVSIIESVSGMISANLPEYDAAISDLDQDELKEAKEKNDSMKVFELLFTKPLNKMAPPTDINGKICPKLIVVDALDEIYEIYLEEFLRIIRDGCSELPSWVKIFITSRRYDIIKKYLFAKHNPIELLVDNAEQRNDVLIYIFHLVQKYATREVSWDDLEVKVEKEFELPEGSLKNELRTLEVHLNRSRFLALRSAK
mmetsp:Transcript_51155/g.61585  ORF Transcript_51155/g.61585 Transcript_51155/m.61585 type:complete len:334 (+) Transcript_51155:68-1069(+)